MTILLQRVITHELLCGQYENMSYHSSAVAVGIGCKYFATGLYLNYKGCKNVTARFICNYDMLTTLNVTSHDRDHQLFGM